MKNLYEKYPVIHLNGGMDIKRGENKPFIPESCLINPGHVAQPQMRPATIYFTLKKIK